MNVILYHNPKCSKSRQTLALLKEKGIDPMIKKYLETPPDEKELWNIINLLGIAPHQLLRKKEAIYKKHHLANPQLSDTEIIKMMVEYPILIERPIVIHNHKAVIGRPPEAVLSIF